MLLPWNLLAWTARCWGGVVSLKAVTWAVGLCRVYVGACKDVWEPLGLMDVKIFLRSSAFRAIGV